MKGQILPIFFLLANYLNAQLISFNENDNSLIIYKVYESYVLGKGIEHEGDFLLKSRKHAFLSKTLKFADKNSEKVVKINCKEIWGFSVKGLLFRVNPKTGSPHALKVKGKDYYYYENGVGTLLTLRESYSHLPYLNIWSDDSSWGFGHYLTKEINSEFLPIFNKTVFKRTLKKHPDLQPFYDCIFAKKGMSIGLYMCFLQYSGLQ